jgi:selenocysteine lyase/cysteine desulfurase
VLYARRSLIEALDVPKVEPAPNDAPARLETGTLNHEGIAGATAAVDFLASLAGGSGRRERLTHALSALHERSGRLFARLWEELSGVPGVRMWGPPPGTPRTPTLGFTIDGVHSRAVAGSLSAGHGLFLSHGDFYAATVVDRLGVRAQGGVVRAGLACYSSAHEVDRLIMGVREIATGRAG